MITDNNTSHRQKSIADKVGLLSLFLILAVSGIGESVLIWARS